MSILAASKQTLSAAVCQSFKKNDVELLGPTVNSITLVDKRVILDQVLREYLHDLISAPPTDIAAVETFVTFTIAACRKDWSSSATPVLFLGDVFDTITLDECERLFTYVENGVDIWKEELFFLPCKNNMLRMCNDLLRRLSRSQNTHFCGRILLFLAKFFPVSERSGLNIVSEFNLENVTEHGGEEEGTDVDMKEFSSDAEEVKPDAKSNIDYNLYCKFWALQDYFRNPNLSYNKVDWKTFTSHSAHILSVFSSYKLEAQCGRSKLDAPATSQQHYFAKYLTNQKLLELQLSDSNFRRYILTQFLIVFQYLVSPTKFKVDSQELKVEQKEWVKETTELVYRLLAETPPDGEQFVSSIRHILAHEERWNDWKNKGCPSIKPPALHLDGEEEGGKRLPPARPRRQKKSLGEIVQEADANNRFYMGNAELTRLWNICPDNLQACKSAERDFLPTLESYFEEAIQQLDPTSQVEDEYKIVSDGNFGWRALRLLARRSPHFFTHSNNPINKLPEYIETMIRKIAKDRPELVRAIPQENPQSPVDVGDEEMAVDLEETSSKAADKTACSAVDQATITAVAAMVGDSWKLLATKLGYTADMVDVFERVQSTEFGQAERMLTTWAQDDEDASAENLVYTLEGLGFDEASTLLKKM